MDELSTSEFHFPTTCREIFFRTTLPTVLKEQEIYGRIILSKIEYGFLNILRDLVPALFCIYSLSQHRMLELLHRSISQIQDVLVSVIGVTV